MNQSQSRYYRIIKPLAMNQSSMILLASRNDEVAVKIGSKVPECGCSLAGSIIDYFGSEREAMLRLRGHAHVIQVLDSTAQTITLGDGKRYHSLAIEVAHYGDVLPYVHLRPFDETLARTYFKQLMSAIQAAHRVGVYHRDVKLENILLSMNFTLKLADFGHAHIISITDDLQQQDTSRKRPRSSSSEPWIIGLCGSPGYVAPEVSDTSYYLGSAADVWSAGCVLFAMLLGHSAFELRRPTSNARDPWLQLLVEGRYGDFWRMHMKLCKAKVPESALDLINRILTVDPTRRITVNEILAHPWMQGPVLSDAEVFAQMFERSELIRTSRAERGSAAVGAGSNNSARGACAVAERGDQCGDRDVYVVSPRMSTENRRSIRSDSNSIHVCQFALHGMTMTMASVSVSGLHDDERTHNTTAVQGAEDGNTSSHSDLLINNGSTPHGDLSLVPRPPTSEAKVPPSGVTETEGIDRNPATAVTDTGAMRANITQTRQLESNNKINDREASIDENNQETDPLKSSGSEYGIFPMDR